MMHDKPCRIDALAGNLILEVFRQVGALAYICARSM